MSYQGSTSPPPTDSHASCVHNDQLFVFGGFTSTNPGGYTNNLLVFNFKTLEWKINNNKNTPVPSKRAGAAVTVLQDKLYMFGGNELFLGLRAENLWIPT